MSQPIRVFCVDDHAFLAEGLKTRLETEADLEVVGWRGSAEGLTPAIRDAAADIVLMDIEMPGPDPFESLADLHRAVPDARVIMLSAFVKDHYINAALGAGAWGYLSKSDAPDEVVAAIRRVHGGEFAFGPEVLERCQTPPGAAADDRPRSRLDALTPRELQVLRMIGRGMTRTDIARTVHRSPKTIDNHRASIMEKLGIHDRVELARYAIREGLTEA